ncbi:hypothetical protein CLH62_06030 [Marinobacter guineae]|uniref:Uncharacterized protein n=1 Tax=Marinobacter guineae TaxID=432303 RepID=A0A2G1VK36_9GAMM|nr:hypothetical protein CLH62_06030 [Marinobacter guineae]
MKKLHSLAFYALITPVLTLGSGAVLAAQGSEDTDLGEQSMGQDADPETQRVDMTADDLQSAPSHKKNRLTEGQPQWKIRSMHEPAEHYEVFSRAWRTFCSALRQSS